MKKIAALVLTLCLLLSMAACGSSAPATSAGSASVDAVPAEGGSAVASDNAPAADDGKVYELTFSYSDPATSPMGVAINAWAEEMKEKSGGRLVINTYPSATLAAPTDETAMTANGSIDLCWQVTAMNKGRFPILDIINTPTFSYKNSYQVMKAAQILYETNEAVKAEFDALGVKVIAIQGTGVNLLASRGVKFEHVADFQGFLVRANNTPTSNLATALGAAPMSCPVGEIYENLSKNVMNGNMSDISNLIATQSYEQLDYVMDYPLGCNAAFVLMNWDKFNSLPEDLQKLIDDSFDSFSLGLTKEFNDYMVKFLNETAGEQNVEVYEPTEEVRAAIDEANQKENVEPWIQGLVDMGLDGQATYDAFQAAFEQACSEYGDEYNWVK